MLLRLGSWVIGFLFIAKAESKLYIVNELCANSYFLLMYIIGYKYWGLAGIGATFTLAYTIYFIQVYLVARKRYEFTFSREFIVCYGSQIALVVGCLILVLFADGLMKYSVGCWFILLSTFLGIHGLNKRIDILGILKQKLNNR